MKTDNTSKIQNNPPDGGYGWIIVIAAFITMTLASVSTRQFSLLFGSFLLKHKTSTTKTALIYNIGTLLWDLSAIFAGPLIKIFGFRKVGIVSGMLVAGSTILSAFVPNPDYLFFVFCIPYGIGGGLISIVSLTIYPIYFKKRLGKVNGIILGGSALSQMCAPMIIRLLQGYYGNQGTILVIGGILLHICATTSLYHPLDWHWKTTDKRRIKECLNNKKEFCVDNYQENETNKVYHENAAYIDVENLQENGGPERQTVKISFETQINLKCKSRSIEKKEEKICSNNTSIQNDGSIEQQQPFNDSSTSLIDFFKDTLRGLLMMKHFKVLILVLSVSLTFMVYLNYLMYLPFVISSRGYDMDFASYCMTIIGICSFVCRLCASALYDHVNLSSKWFYIGGSFVLSLSNFMTGEMTSKNWLLATVALHGFSTGTCATMVNLAVIEFLELDHLSVVLGLIGMGSALSMAIFGPIIGYIRDVVQDYGICLHMLGILQLFATILWFFMPLAQKLDKKRGNDNKSSYYSYYDSINN